MGTLAVSYASNAILFTAGYLGEDDIVRFDDHYGRTATPGGKSA